VLKRYQVLLPDWLEDNIKLSAERFDLSFSEVIRAKICAAILAAVPKVHPEYEPGLTFEEIMDMFTGVTSVKMEREDIHRMLSKIYFETRKAAEYRMSKESGQKKK
jgi:hypothetical protein